MLLLLIQRRKGITSSSVCKMGMGSQKTVPDHPTEKEIQYHECSQEYFLLKVKTRVACGDR